MPTYNYVVVNISLKFKGLYTQMKMWIKSTSHGHLEPEKWVPKFVVESLSGIFCVASSRQVFFALGPLKTIFTIMGSIIQWLFLAKKIIQWLCMNVTSFGMFKREVTQSWFDWVKRKPWFLSMTTKAWIKTSTTFLVWGSNLSKTQKNRRTGWDRNS